ncbi:MAG: hypothetical protein ACOYN8_12970 [Pseudanabaena sp.]
MLVFFQSITSNAPPFKPPNSDRLCTKSKNNAIAHSSNHQTAIAYSRSIKLV